VEDRNDFLNEVKCSLSDNSVLLLMGARDPSLEEFCKELYEKL
jgi:UDP-N-acetylmuramate--alanine ligase